MLKHLHCFLVLLSFPAFGQVTYYGFIGKHPIELITEAYSDGDIHAIYFYCHIDTPITINGRKDGDKVTLYEKNDKEEITATLTFDSVSKHGLHEGIWNDVKTEKKLRILLNAQYNLHDERDLKKRPHLLLQSASTDKYYFRQEISKKEGTSYPFVTAVNVYEKKTDKLFQTFPVDCQLWGLNSMTIDDYNFDGYDDFSVFQQSHAGPNTSRIYFLYDPKTRKYFNSGFEGTSLEFDKKTKTIFERNSCCASTSIMTAIYHIENNQMMLYKRECFKYDEEKEDFIEVECEDY